MTRYRVGNQYLSEDEYRNYINKKYKYTLFAIGAIAAGIITYIYIINPAWPKYLRFICVLAVSISTGTILARFYRAIRLTAALILGITILVVIGLIIWNHI